jgi:hypothetical protein
MKKLSLFLALMMWSWVALAQSPSKVTIKGVVKDTTNESLMYATVMLLNVTDSSLMHFTRSDDEGAFEFKNVKNEPMLLKISYVGFIPYQQTLGGTNMALLDLGKVICKPITSELMEVVIKTAKAPLLFKGDTVEYNASSFKVPPGSTVEDLLRRLPGIDVDGDGNIKAQGKDVKRVYVDGKSFFGNDPKAATRNLNAESITKVQVYNDASEQTKLTGVEDGKREKVMNLELKNEFKKGSFGKLTAATGTQERYALRGNYNRFDKINQLSFIGYFNNINETGVNWDDYSEFKGQNSWNGQDEADFGFASSGLMRFFSGGGDVPMNNFDGRGFTKNGGMGVNYNYDQKKTKLSSNYFYNSTRLNMGQFSDTKTLLENSAFRTYDTLNLIDYRSNHTLNARFEQKLDSFNTLVIKVNAKISGQNKNSNTESKTLNAGSNLLNTMSNLNTSDLDRSTLTTTAIYRKKFRKKGRAFALSGVFNYENGKSADVLNSLNQAILQNPLDIRQWVAKDNQMLQYRGSALYSEPLSKRFFLEGFANYALNQNDNNNQATNPVTATRIDDFSRYYSIDNQYARLGSNLRYSHEGINLSAGVAAQQLSFNGLFSLDKNLLVNVGVLDNTYFNVVPHATASFEFKNNMHINLDYSYNITPPSIAEMMPVQVFYNTNYVSSGNPYLKPRTSHSGNASMYMFNPAKMSAIGFNSTYNKYNTNITQNQATLYQPDKGYVTNTTLENTTGGFDLTNWLWASQPLLKTKMNLNANGGATYSSTPSYINQVLNNTKNLILNFTLGASYSLGSKLMVNGNGKVGYTNISYDNLETLSQTYNNYGGSFGIKWNFLPFAFLETNADVNYYKNTNLNFDRNQIIWNASVRRIFGKNNEFELRMSVFDVLNQRVSLTQNAFNNRVFTQVAPTLARYLMIGLTYNTRGQEAKIKKARMF